MTARYRLVGRVAISTHPERLGRYLIVGTDDKPIHYAETRQGGERWIGSMTGVAARQGKKKGKGEAA